MKKKYKKLGLGYISLFFLVIVVVLFILSPYPQERGGIITTNQMDTFLRIFGSLVISVVLWYIINFLKYVYDY
jgi:hypothetical protein